MLYADGASMRAAMQVEVIKLRRLFNKIPGRSRRVSWGSG